MVSLEKIKNFKGILNTKPKNNRQRVKFGVMGIIFGLFLILLPSWILVYKLQFFQAPGLALYFPGAYAFLLVFLILGLVVVIKATVMLVKK